MDERTEGRTVAHELSSAFPFANQIIYSDEELADFIDDALHIRQRMPLIRDMLERKLREGSSKESIRYARRSTWLKKEVDKLKQARKFVTAEYLMSAQTIETLEEEEILQRRAMMAHQMVNTDQNSSWEALLYDPSKAYIGQPPRFADFGLKEKRLYPVAPVALYLAAVALSVVYWPPSFEFLEAAAALAAVLHLYLSRRPVR